MGYYTYYYGEVYEGQVDEKDVALAIANLPEFAFVNKDDIKTIDDVIAFDSMKWYNCVEDMKKVSLQFPGVTIKIHGDGEDSDDMWNAYFKDGKAVVYRAEIFYPYYDEDDLQ